MAKFIIEVETPAVHRPVKRSEEIPEVYAIRDALTLLAGSITNRGIHDGEITAVKNARVTYKYISKPARNTSDTEPPRAA